MSRARLWFGIGAMAAAQTAVYIARPMTSYRLLGLGGGAGDVGLVTAAFAIIPLFVAIPLGRFADRRHSRGLLVAGCALQAVACVLLGSVESIGAIAAANAVLGLGHLGLALGVQHVIAHETDATDHDRGFAALAAGVSSGQLVGPLLAGFIVSDRQGAALTRASGHAMYLAAGLALVATAAGVAAVAGRAEGGPAREPALGGRLLEIVSIPGVPAGIFASIAVLSSADVLTAYLPVLGQRRGIDPGVIGVLLALRAAASLVARIGIVPLVRLAGRARLIAVSASVAAAAVAALTLSGDPIVLGALLVVAGYGLGFGQPLTMTMVVQRVPRHWAATALAVRLTGNRLGQVAAPALAGVVAGGLGVFSVFWLLGVMLLGSAVAVQRTDVE